MPDLMDNEVALFNALRERANAYQQSMPERMAQMEAMRRAQAERANVRYGDTTLIPAMQDMPSIPSVGSMWRGALDLMDQAGQFASAFGPMGAMAGAGAEAVGQGARMASAVPRWFLGPQARAADVAGANVARAAESRKWAGETSDAARAAMAEREAQSGLLSRAHPPGIGGQASPSMPPLEPEMWEILNTAKANPYTRAVPGRQGIPKREEYLEMLMRYFDEGGALPDETTGPWGRDMQATMREILKRQYSKGRAEKPSAKGRTLLDETD